MGQQPPLPPQDPLQLVPQQIHGGATVSELGGSWSPRMANSDYLPLSGRTMSEHMQQSASAAQSHAQQLPSSSQERVGRTYLPNWRSLSSSWSSWQSPISLRRLRTTSSDRSTAFDTTRRFQPNYRSWNDKDNYYNSQKR
jgi:hypothetical protein